MLTHYTMTPLKEFLPLNILKILEKSLPTHIFACLAQFRDGAGLIEALLQQLQDFEARILTSNSYDIPGKISIKIWLGWRTTKERIICE